MPVPQHHNLQSGKTAGVLITDEQITTQEPLKVNKEFVLDNFTIKPTKRFIIAENELQVQQCDEQAMPAMLEDWKRYVGEDFSGDCVYETTFTMSENTQTHAPTIKFSK